MKKLSLTLITVLAISVAFYGGYYFANRKPVTSTPQNVVAIPTKTLTPDLADIIEKDFVTFVQNTIGKKCPFYKPDGVTYRECLSEWEQDLETKNLSEQNDQVHAHCSTFTKKYADETSLEGQELFLMCAIYKLQ